MFYRTYLSRESRGVILVIIREVGHSTVEMSLPTRGEEHLFVYVPRLYLSDQLSGPKGNSSDDRPSRPFLFPSHTGGQSERLLRSGPDGTVNRPSILVVVFLVYLLKNKVL